MSKPVEHLTERAEFYLCLARVFLPPMEERDYQAIRNYLADDIEELGTALGYPIAGPLGTLRTALAQLPDKQALLQHYSRLFLMPPTPAHLNGGVYLDGAIMGPSVLQIEACYRHFGLACSPDLHDAPDHLSSLLEFLAFLWLSAREKLETDGAPAAQAVNDEARDFAQHYLASWLPALCRDLDAATVHEPTNVYAALARVLRTAVTHDLARTAATTDAPVPVQPDATAAKPGQEAAEPFSCRRCGTAFVPAAGMHDMLTALKCAGLGTEHLEFCPDCRTQAMGLSSMPAPDHKRLRH